MKTIYGDEGKQRRNFLLPSSPVFCLVICLSLFFSFSCQVQTQKTDTTTPAAKTQTESNVSQVTQIDDAKLKELLKPSGKPLLVNFWATWCGPCREEFPDLVKVDNEFRGKIDFITISLDFIEELETGVPQFLTEMNAEMPTYLLISADENTLISSIAKDWSGGLPFTILYRENGEVAYLHQGIVTHATLKAEIEKTLAE